MFAESITRADGSALTLKVMSGFSISGRDGASPFSTITP